MSDDGPGINRPGGGSQFKLFLTADYTQHTNLYFRMSKAPQIRPDFDTDCLWKPPTRSGRVQKERTISMDSTDSEVGALGGRKFSTNEGSSPVPTSPIEAQPRARRMSISEMLFGSSPKSFSWGMDSNNTTTTTTTTAGGADIGERKMSITDDPRFKDFMKHQSKIIGDDGISSAGFKRSNYMKD
ncbi:hypothetical protein L3Y34_004790 [Caenorhabditis briggsae]|uniref:Uncharacterized protein n=1 Tax=Caenorhabditis briggsae TaxID=6238 RepID=A0AAE9AIA4_CAEBR|nr:hypothetical protein L3Y34_004790 [Caenorhabditis briggsae]